jgi:3-oxoacyl-(acyl-carrier-protein) synthase
MMGKRKRVVITGVGPITAIGIGKNQLWDSVINKRSNVVMEDHYLDDEYWGSFHIAKVTDFRIENFGLSPAAVKSISNGQESNPRDLLYLIASSKLALDDSGLVYDRDDNNIGLVLTCENPGLDAFVCRVIQSTVDVIEGRAPGPPELTKKDFIEGLYDRFEGSVYKLQTFMHLHQVSRILGLHGTPLFINNACASGLFALEAASQQIRCGNAPAVIVAGGDDPSFMTKYLWFKRMGIYSEDGVMRPFDKNRNGIVFGDGAAALVLEELGHALHRGALIYGEYLGGGFTQDAWKVTVPSVANNFYGKAFDHALNNSRIEPEQIDLLNPHGAATRIGDKHEALTINEFFGCKTEKPYISAFKSYIGHNLGGSALMELVILLLSVKEGHVPATLNCQEPDPELGIRLVTEHVSAPIKVAAKMSCGFGGYNAVGIFKSLV